MPFWGSKPQHPFFLQVPRGRKVEQLSQYSYLTLSLLYLCYKGCLTISCAEPLGFLALLEPPSSSRGEGYTRNSFRSAFVAPHHFTFIIYSFPFILPHSAFILFLSTLIPGSAFCLSSSSVHRPAFIVCPYRSSFSTPSRSSPWSTLLLGVRLGSWCSQHIRQRTRLFRFQRPTDGLELFNPPS